ncbi:MAG: hypothetical protein L6R37_005882 [Teloschistes peruensis]|nr:MAG: hypothetical protein L6R37_005882 [Teloschistes peruensis]
MTTTTQALFDLVTRPEYIQPIRDEIIQALEDEVKEEGKDGWQKSAFDKIPKLDSFMKESQSFSRVALSSITLSDGFQLARGTHFTIPTANLLHDPSIIPDPEVFNGFRYYNPSSQSAERQNRFTATDSNNLSFGHGKYTCPGRFLASYTIKLVVAMLLVRFDIGFPKGKGRPRNIRFADAMFPYPNGEILLEERKKT